MNTYKNSDLIRLYKSRVAHDRIGPNFELIRDLMRVLVTCKNKEDRIKNKGTRVAKTHYNPTGAICCHGNNGSDPI